MHNIDIRLRISSEIKSEAEVVFHEMGMTLTEAIRIFLKQSINSGGLPFKPHVRILNSETINSFNEKEEGAYSESSLYEFKTSLNLD